MKKEGRKDYAREEACKKHRGISDIFRRESYAQKGRDNAEEIPSPNAR
jgi:hypothetical protein